MMYTSRGKTKMRIAAVWIACLSVAQAHSTLSVSSKSSTVVTKPVKPASPSKPSKPYKPSKPSKPVTKKPTPPPASTTTANNDDDSNDDDYYDDDDDTAAGENEDDDDDTPIVVQKPKETRDDDDDDDDKVNDQDDDQHTEHVFDEHHCCTSCGHFYCHSSKKCVSEWSDCNMGHYDSSACTFTYNGSDMGDQFHFDLSPYRHKTQYGVKDTFKHKGQSFTYYFKLCELIDTHHLPHACSVTKGTGEESCSNDAMAFQYLTTDWGYSACYRLSHCFQESSTHHNQELGLIDPVEPAKGLYIKYTGGNTCPNGYSDRAACYAPSKKLDGTFCARSFRLNIYCHDEIEEIPQKEEVVEQVGCEYVVNINHRMGCPVECPRGANGKLCSGHGTCYYAGIDDDGEEDNLSCRCSHGYYGDYCENAGIRTMIETVFVSVGPPTWLLRTLLVFFIIGIVLAVIVNYERLTVLASGLYYLSRPYIQECCDFFGLGAYGPGDGRGRYSSVARKAPEEFGLSGGDRQVEVQTFERMALGTRATNSGGIRETTSV